MAHLADRRGLPPGGRADAPPLANQLPIGVALALRGDPGRDGGKAARFHTIHRDGACVGAVVQSPPWKANLSTMSIEVAAFAAERFETSAILGTAEAASAFAAVACRGRPVRVEADLGLFELTAVNAVRPCMGGSRTASQGDADMLQAWHVAYRDEAVPLDPVPSPEAGTRAVERGTAWLWVDRGLPERGGVVAWASFGRDLMEYLSVGPVYTPPELRGRGYATNLVAAMSTWALAQGRRGCTLFTDLGNPTSNAIYERIGYRRVGTMRGYGW